ncbi:MAG TPA: EamA family transporter [Bacteroidetes bacterium]|nr:EamA family transporter [Bacteroidota bacterium]
MEKDNTVIIAIICCLLWASVYSTIKVGLQYDTPIHFAGVRFIIGGLMILPFTVRPTAFVAMVREHWKIVLLVTLLQGVTNYTLFYIGMDLVPGAIGAVVVGSQPLFTALVSASMDKEDKLTKRKIITIFIALMGLVLISAGRQALKLGSLAELLGIFLILGANLATSVSNVMISLKDKKINPFVLSSTSILISGVILFLASLVFEQRPENVSLPAPYRISLLWLSFVSAAAFSLWYMLLKRPGVKVSELNLWKFLIPVVGAILSWIILPEEHPEWITIAGMVIIAGSLVLFHWKGKAKDLRQ